jgi:hypothetical protein
MYGMGYSSEDLFPGESAIPLVRKKEHFMIIVAGGPGRHWCWMPTFGGMTRSITRALVRQNGTPAKSIQEFKR